MGAKLFMDFRGKTVRIVEGRAAGKKPEFKVLNYGQSLMPYSLDKERSEEELDECAGVLDDFLNHSGMKSKRVTAGLGMNGIISRNARVPKMKMRDLDNMMKLEINEYLPVNPEEYAFDYKIADYIEEEGRQYFDLILAAVPHIQAVQCAGVMEKAGLKPEVLDILPNMLHRLFTPLIYEDSLVLDGGIDGTHLAIFKGRELFMYADIPFVAENENSNFSVLAREMSGYLDYYSSRNFGKPVGNVIVLGGLTEILEVKETLDQFLTMPVFAGIHNPEIFTFRGKAAVEIKEQCALFAGNLGLMMRDFSDTAMERVSTVSSPKDLNGKSIGA